MKQSFLQPSYKDRKEKNQKEKVELVPFPWHWSAILKARQ